MDERLVFVAGRGFMPGRALGSAANVVIERAGHTFTGHAAPDRDGIRVMFTVTNVQAEVPADPFIKEQLPDFRPFRAIPGAPVRVADEFGREVPPRPRWSAGMSLRAETDAFATLHGGLILEHPQPDARELTVAFGGPAGDWRVPLPLVPIDFNGVAASPVDRSVTINGITVAVTACARTPEATVLELEGYVDPLPAPGTASRRVIGIGAGMRGARFSGDPLILRDERSGMYLERGRPLPQQTGGKEREAVTFEPVHAEARALTLTVDAMWIQEPYEDAIGVAIPFDGDISYRDLAAHVTVTRREGVYTNGAVRVETSSDRGQAKRLVFFHSPDIDGGTRLGMQMEHAVGKDPIVTVPDPTGRATEIQLRAPVVEHLGPWRVDFVLPSGSEGEAS